jgi:NAD(P)-dependent dehydrogenase (short-subunit alcohol dehydrogenase family)
VVQHLVSRGHAVTVFDLEAPADGSVSFERVDVSDEAGVVAAVEAAAGRFGGITGLVTCHGIRGEFVSALDLDLDRTRRLIDIHVIGTLSVAREIVRRLEGRDASIVTVSSTTAYGGWASQSDYGVAKAAVRQLTENLAIEWAPLGVRVNSVAPGMTLTPMLHDLVAGGYDLAPALARTPLGRLATPEEMAASIVFLLCDASFVTGQCLPVDGGWTVVGK